MRITPLDVRKQEFGKTMRGFDCDEVRAFLGTLAGEYEAVLVDNKEIRERIAGQDEKIAEYKSMERTLRDTLMTAERVMQETRENASREGQLIVQEAQAAAKNILEECRLRTEELRREIVGLRKEKETYLARFRGLAEAQIKFIDTHESDFEDLDKRLVDIVDTVMTSVTAPHQVAATPAVVSGASTASNNGPQVAPAPVAAPVASERDIWRDYQAGEGKVEDRADEGQVDEHAGSAEATATSIADIVTASVEESSDSVAT